MKRTILKFIGACALLLSCTLTQAQIGLEGIIVEEFHTLTQADADASNNLSGSTFAVVAGAKVYRIYVDMAPGYRLATIFGGAETFPGSGVSLNPLNVSTTTTFWNNDNLVGPTPSQTRFVDNGNFFDSYLTVGTTGLAGGTNPCGSATAQLGIRRSLDTNGDLTTCAAYPGFTGNDGSYLGTAPGLTTNLTEVLDFAALEADGNNFTMVNDAWATLPAQTGFAPNGQNLLLVGQFTTNGVFSFKINVAVAATDNSIEEYLHTTPAFGQFTRADLTFPLAACVPPVSATAGSNSPLCAGQNLTLTSSGVGVGPFTYSWTGPNGFTSAAQNPSVPNAVAGAYVVTVSNGCAPGVTATATVVVNTPANAGTNGSLIICAGSTVNAAQLFAQLGGSPAAGGSWSPAFAGAGVYTYTVTGVAPCTNATATVTVTAQPAPNAGSNGTLTICAGSTVNAVQLFAQLGGTPAAGGSWSPAFAGASVYTYTVAAVAPCTVNATATVTVTAQPAPNAGSNGTLTICAGSTVNAAQLFAQLGGTPAAGGSWSPAFAGAGVYTYTVAAVAPCTVNATATVTVTAQPAPNAGSNGTLSICAGSTVNAVQLFAQLGGTPAAGGSWSPAFAGAGVYTYTVAAVAPCTVNATATVTVTEQAAPNAGSNGAISICTGATLTAADLFAALGGTPNTGGVWSPTPAGAGTYTYTVNAVAPCTGTATAQVVVTTGTGADAGTNGTLSICAGTTVTAAQLFAALNGTPNTGGSWSPAFAGAGTYTYAVVAVSPCTGTASAQVVVTAQPAPNAGTNGTLTICAGSTVTAAQLFAQLGGTPASGGSWNPAFAGAGVYTYTVAAVAPCTVNATATVTVTAQPQPNAGTNGTLARCTASNVTAAELFAQLGGTPNVGGSWSPAFAGAGVYTYSVAAVAPCTVNATASVTVTQQVPGTPCDDGNANTSNDVLGLDCTCSGTLANDCLGVPGGPAQPGTSCDDGLANTTNDIWNASCQCVGTPVLPNDCLGVPGGPALPGTSCNDGLANTVNDTWSGACVCAGTPLPNDCLGVSGGPAVPGSPCNDGNTNTENDVWSLGCVCAGTPIGGGCTLNALVLQLETNGGNTTTWEVRTEGTNILTASGGGYAAGIVTENLCIANGCYTLRVFDSAGDGLGVGGGYQLRQVGSNPADIRIVDNLGNFTSGSVSAIGNGPRGICFPMASNPKPIFLQRDKVDFVSGTYLNCEAVQAVSNVWITGAPNSAQSATTGYEFWLFDPNGSYSYRRFRNHQTTDGSGLNSPNRACAMKINNWFASQAAPANVLLNVRIRPRVNNVNGPWGPAYRFKIDPVRAACPLTQLNNTPGNQFESCNKSRVWGGANTIHARPVPNANRYQWRFRNGEGVTIIRTSNTYFLTLNWGGNPLLVGQTYDVDVRASKNNGASYCIDALTPVLDEWGAICTLTIIGAPAQGGSQNLALQSTEVNLSLYPNPNRGDQVMLSIDAVEAGVETISVDFYDLAGHRAVARTIPTQGDRLNSLLELNGLAAGVYIVHIRAGEKIYTERLVVSQ